VNLTAFRGEWAVVTGASAGIGQEFARQLALRGINVALVARRGELLHKLADEIHKDSGVEALPLELDLTEPKAANHLQATLSSKGVSARIIVNNAAIGRWGRFDAAPAEAYEQMLAVNLAAVVGLCRLFLPELEMRPPAAIVNVSSPAALQPVPYMAAYAASKAYVHSLSLALHEEWRKRGVYVQTLLPGPTATEFDTLAGAYPSQLGASRSPPAKAVLASLAGFHSEVPLVVSASGTYLQRMFAAVAPTSMVLQKVGKMFHPPK
jgi:uncharacterized protein